MRVGTCHFASWRTAMQYYRGYTDGPVYDFVNRKLRDGEIKIGPPKVKKGERLSLNSEGRYIVEVIQ